MADIVINGCLADPGCLAIPPKLDPITCVSTYCAKFPTTAIKITGNCKRDTHYQQCIVRAIALLLTGVFLRPRHGYAAVRQGQRNPDL